MKILFENFYSEMDLCRVDIKEKSAEILTIREAVTLYIACMMKNNVDICTEINKVLKEKEIFYVELCILRLTIAGS